MIVDEWLLAVMLFVSSFAAAIILAVYIGTDFGTRKEKKKT